MARLRVLHMIGAAKPGGAEMFALRLLTALHRRADVEILAVVRAGSWLEKALKESGVTVKSVPFGGMFDFRTRGMVARIAREFAPDVVQSWMNRATRFVPKGPWATVARLGGFYDLKYYRGKVVHLIGNTPAIVDYCVAEGWDRNRVAMIGNFIPEPVEGWRSGRAAMRRELGISDGDCVLMMAGRIHRVKGIDVAMQALAALPEKFVLLLVGEGPLRAELTEFAKNLGVVDRVRWVGWRDGVSDYAAAADLWLAPSRHEPLGNTVLDGWVHGVPVIAARTGGLAMLVEDEKSGLLVEVEDVEGLRKAIMRLEADKKLQEQVVKGGLARFAKDFSEDGIVGKYVAYYRGLSEGAAVYE